MMSKDGLGIAIIGMTGRFPGARNLREYWRNLRDGVESISFFHREAHADASTRPGSKADGAHYVHARGILEGVELFDAAFFGISPREAEITDPQQRMFLECAWEALETAGYAPEKFDGSVGVYAGVCTNTYQFFNIYPNPEIIKAVGAFQIQMRNDKDHLPTFVSYKLNLKGPSVAVQTACSTSLVAIHLASTSLLSGDCDIALAGGATVTVPQKAAYQYREGGIMSPDGHCRAFDARAEGTVGGNGAGIVVLRRLEDALAAGDHILAIIRGTAINNDGSEKVGYTAPSLNGQAQVIEMAQGIADVPAETVSYVEAHGTGTALGDPIEVAALTQAFRDGGTKKGYCAIGSVKSNIGHLDAAAGVAGLIKTVLALKHKMIPPSLHFHEPNPEIDFENSPFYVNPSLTQWRRGETPLRAGVSSFGIGGTNAHIVLEEAAEAQPSGESRAWHLLALSAKTPAALDAATSNLVSRLRQNPAENLADVAYTLHLGRADFGHRRIVVCRDVEDAVKCLDGSGTCGVHTSMAGAGGQALTFMFPGQGSQYPHMGGELYRSESIFREHVDQCSEMLRDHLGFDLRSVLYPLDSASGAAAEKLNQTLVSQTALFTAEYAQAQLWMSWGVHPQSMIGHSIGEYVAACLAGVLQLDECLVLVATRGKLMQQLPAGQMLAVPRSEQEVRPFLSSELSLAAVNGPASCVVSGRIEAIAELRRRFDQQHVDGRLLHTSHAFHSAMMDPILKPFEEAVRRVTLRPPQIPYLSCVTGTWIRPEEATDPNYWVRHLRQTVRFADGVTELLREPGRILLEVGFGRILCALASEQTHEPNQQTILPSVMGPRDAQHDVVHVLTALGELWLNGVDVDWAGFYAGQRRHRVLLPTYPFERKRFWLEPPAGSTTVERGDDHEGSNVSGEMGLSRSESQLVIKKPAETAAFPLQLGLPASGLRVSSEPGGEKSEPDFDEYESEMLESVFSEQIEIMCRQLELLRPAISAELSGGY
jgi:acyl transferase domain-containing protein